MTERSSNPAATLEPPGPHLPAQGWRARRIAWLDQYRWLVFVVPFAVYMVGNSFEPLPEGGKPAASVPASGQPSAATDDSRGSAPVEPGQPADDESGARRGWIAYRYYPWVYTAKIFCTLAAMAMVWPGYLEFPRRVSVWAFLVGAVGVWMWVALVEVERQFLGRFSPAVWLGLGTRSAFNPVAEMAENPGAACAFLAIRLTGLALVVPVIEEFFLRGFLGRFLIQDAWWRVPFGTWHVNSLVLITLVAVAMHPSESLAALCWFSTVSWLMLQTRNIWDCVVAHATTNLLLGAYVFGWGDWTLL